MFHPEEYIPPTALYQMLSEQCHRSGIKDINLPMYCMTAEWLIRRYGNTANWSLTEDALEWLEQEGGFRHDQRVMAEYIIRLIVDYHNGRTSEPCQIFTITCSCGRQVSRKDAASHQYPMYRCTCGKACGYHKGDGWPLGLMADQETRKWRVVLHETYAELCEYWRTDNKNGYTKLASLLSVPQYRCHFSLVGSASRAQEINQIMQAEIDRLKETFSLTA